MTQELLAELTDSEANRLRKWGSLWLDLLHVDMALHERAKLPNSLANTFVRRALWESAVISYGRMGFSGVRRLEYEELLDAVGGQGSRDFHAQVMGWRHGHVAHRTDRAYEETAVVAQHADGNTSDPEALNLLISTWVGPDDDTAVAHQFMDHANKLRVALWEKYLAPIGERVTERHSTATAPARSFAGFTTEAERLVATCTLWTRSNGTGIDRPKGRI
jgi:hypothetical protein